MSNQTEDFLRNKISKISIDQGRFFVFLLLSFSLISLVLLFYHVTITPSTYLPQEAGKIQTFRQPQFAQDRKMIVVEGKLTEVDAELYRTQEDFQEQEENVEDQLVLGETTETTPSTLAQLPISQPSIPTITGISIPTITGIIDRPGKTDRTVEKLKKQTVAQIDRTIQSLTKLQERVNEIKNLTPDQKEVINRVINALISQLTALKEKIENDNTIMSLQEDGRTLSNLKKEVSTISPQIRILISTEKLSDVRDLLEKRVVEIEQQLLQLPVNELKVKIQDRLQEAREELNNAQNLIAQVEGKMITMDVQNFAGKKEALQQAQQMLGSARREVGKARGDIGWVLAKLRSALKASCAKDIAEAKASAIKKVCTQVVESLQCPYNPRFTYRARNGCEIDSLKGRGWTL